MSWGNYQGCGYRPNSELPLHHSDQNHFGIRSEEMRETPRSLLLKSAPCSDKHTFQSIQSTVSQLQMRSNCTSNDFSPEGSIRNRDEGQNIGSLVNKDAHDEKGIFPKPEQGSTKHDAVSSTPPAAALQTHDFPDISTALPPHVRMLPPHLRAEGMLRWEASQREAAAAAEKKRQEDEQRQQRQKDLFNLKAAAMEEQALHNAAWAAFESQERTEAATGDCDAAIANTSPTEAAPSAKRWVVDDEDSHQLQNGRTVSNMRLRLVSDDRPSTSLCTPGEEAASEAPDESGNNDKATQAIDSEVQHMNGLYTTKIMSSQAKTEQPSLTNLYSQEREGKSHLENTVQKPSSDPQTGRLLNFQNALPSGPRITLSNQLVVPELASPQPFSVGVSGPTTPVTPTRPALATSFTKTYVGSIKSGGGTTISDDSVNPISNTVTERDELTRQWVSDVGRFGPLDWLNCTFQDEDAAAAKVFGVQRNADGEINPMARDDYTELTADRQRLPTLLRVTDLGKGHRRNLSDMVANADGRLRLGAVFRSQHGDGGPMEPTGALYTLRMKILCNFAKQCRDAEHSVLASPEAPPIDTAVAAEAVPATGQAGPSSATPSHPPTFTSSPAVNLTIQPGPSKITSHFCRCCARGNDFVMGKQHSRLFLESVLLPLSECSTYTDMLVHVNTCVSERVFSESGLGSANDNPYDGALRYEDIKTMPLYEDYQAALTLATHRQRVMSMLPMATDINGLLCCKSE
ncbi:hypothetical protein SEPCBS57363_002266 [Sporothrix epigloea]|uniref:Uncharacterized protein n=1 Tax=Sporothrix epigloea TaxID=1892477 RepID=A0ABP0DEX9_9PEZI